MLLSSFRFEMLANVGWFSHVKNIFSRDKVESERNLMDHEDQHFCSHSNSCHEKIIFGPENHPTLLSFLNDNDERST